MNKNTGRGFTPVVGPSFLTWREYELRRLRSERRERFIDAFFGNVILIPIAVILPALAVWWFTNNLGIGLFYCMGAFCGIALGTGQSEHSIYWRSRSDWFTRFESWLPTRSDEELLEDARQWTETLSVAVQYPRDENTVMECNALVAECWRRGILDQLSGLRFVATPNARGGDRTPE
jgi:hypothetical protein